MSVQVGFCRQMNSGQMSSGQVRFCCQMSYEKTSGFQSVLDFRLVYLYYTFFFNKKATGIINSNHNVMFFYGKMC